MDSKNRSCHSVGMLGPPLQDQVRHIHIGRTNGSAGLTVQAGFHHSLGIQVTVVLGRHNFEPATGTHILGLKHIIDRSDRITLRTGRTGFSQPVIIDMLGERHITDLDAWIQDSSRVQRLLHFHK